METVYNLITDKIRIFSSKKEADQWEASLVEAVKLIQEAGYKVIDPLSGELPNPLC